MEKFFEQNPALAVTLLIMAGSIIGFLIKKLWDYVMKDRDSVIAQIKEGDKHLEISIDNIANTFNESKKKIWEELNYVKGEMDEIKENYNQKFQKVYDNQAEQVQVTNENHIELLKAIQQVELKIK